MSESGKVFLVQPIEDGELLSFAQELKEHHRRIANRISFDKPEGIELHEGQQVTLHGMPARDPMPVTVVEVTEEKVYVEEDE